MRDLLGYTPIRFGDEQTADLYRARVERARAAQQTRWAVAPGLSVVTPNGIRLGEGTPVTLAMLVGAPLGAEQHMRRLVEHGYVLESLSFSGGPEAA